MSKLSYVCKYYQYDAAQGTMTCPFKALNEAELDMYFMSLHVHPKQIRKCKCYCPPDCKTDNNGATICLQFAV